MAGFKWRDPEKKTYQVTLPAENIPDIITDVPDSVVNEVIGCAHEEKCSDQCTSAFRVREKDLEFYKRANLPLPRLCPNCRHSERFKQRNTLRLYKRSCMCDNKVYINSAPHAHGSLPCSNEFETSYAPDKPEIVYCQKCYLQEVA